LQNYRSTTYINHIRRHAGLLGIGIAKKEGLEVNLFGLVYGVRVHPFSITLPGFGSIPNPEINTHQ
jgi:hypothetical protein